MEESRRQAAIQLGLTPDQLKGLEAQAQKPGEHNNQPSDKRPVVPDAQPLPEGEVAGRYRWRQTPTEVEIIVPVEDVVKARDIAWFINQTHLTVGVKGREVLKKAKLTHDVKLGAGHNWQMDSDRGQRCILVTLEKKGLHEKWLAIESDMEDGTTEVETQDVRPSPVASISPAVAAVGPAMSAPEAPLAVESARKELAQVEAELLDVKAQISALCNRQASLMSRQKELRATVDGSK